MMRFYGIILIIAATNVSSAAMVQCNADLKVSLSYNHETKSFEFMESSENLSNISINFDSGFIKLSDNKEDKIMLFRQSAISKNFNDPLDLVVRYETASKAEIQKTSVIINDPMCKNNSNAKLSIFETSALGYTNNIHSCDCLSNTYDRSNFINLQ